VAVKAQTSEGDVPEKTKFNQEDFLRSVDSFDGNLRERAYRTGLFEMEGSGSWGELEMDRVRVIMQQQPQPYCVAQVTKHHKFTLNGREKNYIKQGKKQKPKSRIK
jgi:hypothetical protein